MTARPTPGDIDRLVADALGSLDGGSFDELIRQATSEPQGRSSAPPSTLTSVPAAPDDDDSRTDDVPLTNRVVPIRPTRRARWIAPAAAAAAIILVVAYVRASDPEPVHFHPAGSVPTVVVTLPTSTTTRPPIDPALADLCRAATIWQHRIPTGAARSTGDLRAQAFFPVDRAGSLASDNGVKIVGDAWDDMIAKSRLVADPNIAALIARVVATEATLDQAKAKAFNEAMMHAVNEAMMHAVASSQATFDSAPVVAAAEARDDAISAVLDVCPT